MCESMWFFWPSHSGFHIFVTGSPNLSVLKLSLNAVFVYVHPSFLTGVIPNKKSIPGRIGEDFGWKRPVKACLLGDAQRFFNRCIKSSAMLFLAWFFKRGIDFQSSLVSHAKDGTMKCVQLLSLFFLRLNSKKRPPEHHFRCFGGILKFYCKKYSLLGSKLPPFPVHHH